MKIYKGFKNPQKKIKLNLSEIYSIWLKMIKINI